MFFALLVCFARVSITPAIVTNNKPKAEAAPTEFFQLVAESILIIVAISAIRRPKPTSITIKALVLNPAAFPIECMIKENIPKITTTAIPPFNNFLVSIVPRIHMDAHTPSNATASPLKLLTDFWPFSNTLPRSDSFMVASINVIPRKIADIPKILRRISFESIDAKSFRTVNIIFKEKAIESIKNANPLELAPCFNPPDAILRIKANPKSIPTNFGIASLTELQSNFE